MGFEQADCIIINTLCYLNQSRSLKVHRYILVLHWLSLCETPSLFPPTITNNLCGSGEPPHQNSFVDSHAFMFLSQWTGGAVLVAWRCHLDVFKCSSLTAWWYLQKVLSGIRPSLPHSQCCSFAGSKQPPSDWPRSSRRGSERHTCATRYVSV